MSFPRGVEVLITFAVLTVSAVSAQSPNVLYILGDDQAWTDFGFMGNERVHTPHLDALAKESAVFVNGYVPTSVCRPSLATLLTGLYPHQHRIHFNHGPPGNAGYNRMKSSEKYVETRKKEFELIQKVETLPRLLAKRGYRSLQTGKFWEGHWKNAGFTEGMTTFTAPQEDQTFGGIRRLANGERVAHGNGDAGLQIGRETIEPIYSFIQDCEKAETPWLVWYAPYLPHLPHDAPKKFFDLAQSRPKVAPHEVPYFASIAQFDHTVGELMKFLEENELLKNTIIVFASDNGWSPSKQRRGKEYAQIKNSKRSPFDLGLRTPVLLRWDGQMQPGKYSELISTIDLMPTILSATKSPSATTLPGINLLQFANSPSRLLDPRPVFGEIYPGDATSFSQPQKHIAYRWVRHGDWKLIVSHTHPPQTAPWGSYMKSEALYDLKKDPFETNNLAKNDKHRTNVLRLRRILDEWWKPSKADAF
jgi:arylsulfatase A